MFFPQRGKSDEEIAAESKKEQQPAPQLQDDPTPADEAPSFDDDLCFWAHLRMTRGDSEAQVRKRLREAGHPPKHANEIVQTAIYHRDYFHQRAKSQASARSIKFGCAMLVGGLLLAFASKMAGSAVGTFLYFVFTGLFVGGFGLVVRGFLARAGTKRDVD